MSANQTFCETLKEVNLSWAYLPTYFCIVAKWFHSVATSDKLVILYQVFGPIIECWKRPRWTWEHVALFHPKGSKKSIAPQEKVWKVFRWIDQLKAGYTILARLKFREGVPPPGWVKPLNNSVDLTFVGVLLFSAVCLSPHSALSTLLQSKHTQVGQMSANSACSLSLSLQNKRTPTATFLWRSLRESKTSISVFRLPLSFFANTQTLFWEKHSATWISHFTCPGLPS